MRTKTALAFGILCFSAFAIDDKIQRSDEGNFRGWVDAAISAGSVPRLRHDKDGMWRVSHGVLALGRDFKMLPLAPGKKPLDGFHWLTMSGNWKGQMAFEPTPFGVRGKPYNEEDEAFEGHSDQFLAYLTELNLPLDHKIYATNRYATIQELVNNAKANVNISPVPGYEYEPMYTLWALSHYLPPDAQWKNTRGESWSIEQLVKWTYDETQNTRERACAGTHHLEALVVALKKWQATEQPMRSPWNLAKNRIDQHIEIARANQNPDGSFSKNFFWNKGFSNDYLERIPGNGHTLEFLTMALPDERINEVWVRRGALSVAMDLYNNRNNLEDSGAFYHALHGLILYKARTYGKQ